MFLRQLVEKVAKDPDRVCETLAREYGSLPSALDADARDLALSLPGEARAASLLSLIRHTARYIQLEAFGQHPALSSAARAMEFVKALYVDAFYERCCLICLDARFRMIRYSMMARGSITEVNFYHRQIAEEALRSGSAYVIVAHNHPSGMLQFSLQDLQSTGQAARQLSALGVTLLDHILTANGDTYSLRQSGLMNPEQWGGEPEAAQAVWAWMKA